MNISQEQLSRIIKNNADIAKWHAALVPLLDRYKINTVNRLAGFLAQCGHESHDFKFVKENLNYSQEGLRKTFAKYFPTDALAAEYARKPEKIANRVYASRMGNGDEASGDGFKYSGKGLIQLTGRTNCSKFAESIGRSLEDTVAYLLTIEGAAESAAWFWSTNGLNEIADADDIVKMTKRINGGTIGLDDRTARYKTAKSVLAGA